jgi:hypothetical protein
MGTTDAEIRAMIWALADGSRLSIQSREHWMPLRNLRIRAQLDLASKPEAAAPAVR